MIVGKVALSTARGAPTLTVTPEGALRNVRSPAETVEKFTGLLKVTVMTLGAWVIVAPLAGVDVLTRKRSTALIALIAFKKP